MTSTTTSRDRPTLPPTQALMDRAEALVGRAETLIGRAETLIGGALDLLRVPPPDPGPPLDLGPAAAALCRVGAEVARIHASANFRPWTATGLAALKGAPITWLTHGDSWIITRRGPHFDAGWQLRVRTGGSGPALVGTGPTHTAAAPNDGPIEVCSLFPGELRDGDEHIVYDRTMPRALFRGGFDVVVATWPGGADVASRLQEAVEHDPTGLCRRELDRIREPVVPPPGWEAHHHIPLAGLHHGQDGQIDVHSRGRVEIVCHPARIPLTSDLRLRWRWRLNQMPSRRAENTLLTHDYMSVAAEFDDGKDLAYHWSTVLPLHAGYRCPYPHWREREWHLVVRSGGAGIGEWQTEERMVSLDRDRAIGGTAPREVVRVWLIVNCLAPGAEASASYTDITLVSDKTTIRVL